MIDLYIVTRMSGNKNNVPNLGVFFNYEKAENHFLHIVEDRKGRNRAYKCEVAWVSNRIPTKDLNNNVVKEAYITHPKTSYQKEYVEMLRIEWYSLPAEDLFLENI